MKNKLSRKSIIWICCISLLVLIAAGVLIYAQYSSKQVKTKLNIQQCRQMVDDAINTLPVTTAECSKYIIENTKVTVNDIEYGYEKDIILSCTYETINTKAALEDKIDSLMEDAYTQYKERLDKDKKVNGTQVGIWTELAIQEYLKNAAPVSGEITLYIYETTKGMEFYYDSSALDTITGGMFSISRKITDTMQVQYQGETVDITKNGTLRTGVAAPLAVQNLSTEKPFTGGFLVELWLDFKYDFHRNFIEDNRYMSLIKGLGTTLLLTLLSAVLGILLGFLIAIVRCTNQMTGKLKFIDSICRGYLTIIRGTPVMVQLLIIYFVILLPIGVEKYAAAVICFGMNSGAYVAEIVRGGIMSIDKGQIEAGRSLGFNYVQTMVNFVVPQAFKAILPSLANEFITLLKESSVAFTIGVADLTFGGNKIRSVTYSPFLPLLAVALIYLLLVMVMTKLVSLLERRLAKSDH